MKLFYAIVLLSLPFSFFSQGEIREVSWDDLVIGSFEISKNAAGSDYNKAVFSDDQVKLDNKEVIIAGNYHVLDNFGSKTYLLSRDEIIMHPMQRDEVIRLKMDKDPEIYFGRKLKIKGVLHIDSDPEAETIYYITDVKKVKNTGTLQNVDMEKTEGIEIKD